jgi:hypothetical protein
MKLGKKFKQPKEIQAIYDDDSGRCGKFSYNEDKKEWEYEHKYSEMNEEECSEAHKILKKLNKSKEEKN